LILGKYDRTLGKIDAIAYMIEKGDRILIWCDALCILDLRQKNYQIKPMSTYNEVLSQVQSLTSDEQLRLLEELAVLVRRKVTSDERHRLRELQGVSKDKWQGFLPKRVDALEFQRSLRQEWGE